jgi:hypothetical protein
MSSPLATRSSPALTSLSFVSMHRGSFLARARGRSSVTGGTFSSAVVLGADRQSPSRRHRRCVELLGAYIRRGAFNLLKQPRWKEELALWVLAEATSPAQTRTRKTHGDVDPDGEDGCPRERDEDDARVECPAFRGFLRVTDSGKWLPRDPVQPRLELRCKNEAPLLRKGGTCPADTPLPHQLQLLGRWSGIGESAA